MKVTKKDGMFFVEKRGRKSVGLTKPQLDSLKRGTSFNVYANGTTVVYNGKKSSVLAKGETKKERRTIERAIERERKPVLREFTVGGKKVLRDRYGRIRGDKLDDFDRVTFFKAKGHFLNSELPSFVLSAPTAFFSTAYLNKALWRGVISEERLISMLNDALGIIVEPGRSSDFRNVYNVWEYRYQVAVYREGAIIGTEVDIFRGK